MNSRMAFVSAAAGQLGPAMAHAPAEAGAHVVLNGRNFVTGAALAPDGGWTAW
jgi:NAD(P)-dependent dehydrogenase (short-subunit alcohol dehydrogenase family)